MHHNVIWNVQGVIMVKGYNHNIYKNTAFDNGDKNDIIIMIDQGGNDGTITVNNIANKIAGHRTGDYQSYPVPGNYENNWNGYELGFDIKDFLVDAENYNFSPIENSSLIDSGLIYDNLEITYVGEAPDIGAYEFGGDYWVPGITWDLSEEFNLDFYPPNELNILLGDVNYDQTVNVTDIILLINWILSDYYILIADLNQDEILNIIDVISIVNIIID